MESRRAYGAMMKRALFAAALLVAAVARPAAAATPTPDALATEVYAIGCCGTATSDPSCAATVAAYRRGFEDGRATQRALTATATITATSTLAPTEEPTPTSVPTADESPTPRSTVRPTPTTRDASATLAALQTAIGSFNQTMTARAPTRTPTVRNVGTSTPSPTISHTPTPAGRASRVYLPELIKGRPRR